MGKLPILDSKSFHVRILLIDPHSEGAYLRSEAEAKEGDFSRLFDEVNHTMDLLSEIENKVNSNKNERLSVEIKLYRTSPSAFMVLTSSTVFVEPYYFRPNHNKSNYPMVKFYNPGEKGSVYHEYNFHFDWIWEKASVFLNEQIHGINLGNYETIKSEE